MIKFLWRELKGNRCSFLMGHVLTPVSNFLMTALVAVMVGMVYSLMEEPADKTLDSIWKLVVAILLLILTQSAGSWLYKKAAILTMRKIELKVAAQMQRISYTEYQKKHSGEWISYFTNELKILKKFMLDTIADLLLPLVTGTGCIVLLFYYSWEIAVFSLLMVLLGQLLHKVFAKKQKENAAAVMEANAAVGSRINDIVTGAATIRFCGHEEYWREHYDGDALVYRQAELHQTFTNAVHKLLSSILGSITFIGPFMLGILLVHRGIYSLAVVMFCAQLTGNLNWFFGNFAKALAEIQECNVAYERLEKFWNIPYTEKTVDAGESKFCKIEGKGFSVGYEGKDRVVDNLDFQIESGKKIALMGSSGSGKSTFMKGLMGFLVHDGILLVDGKEMADEGLRQSHVKIAYVPQEMQLTGDSLKNILTYWREENWAAAKKACEIVEISDFIEGLSEKENTVLQEKGASVSRGQLQRLALARALVCQPQILLMDEATSGLDALTEKKVFENIWREYPDMTILFITHQMSNTVFADMVWEMRNGKIIKREKNSKQ